MSSFVKAISKIAVTDIGKSDRQSIYLTRKLHGMKSDTHKQVKIRSVKTTQSRL